MHLPTFAYHAPQTLAQALKLKSEMGAAASILAGGTDLLVNLKHRLLSPAAVIGLKQVEELRGIQERPDSVVIKAGTTLAEAANHPAVQQHFPMLVRAIRSIGALGIQHFRGTMGGNLCLGPRCILYNQSLFWRSGKDKCHRTGGKDCLALQGSESCQAVCSGDTVPALAAYAAQLTLSSSGGSRTIPIMDFFTGKGESPFNLSPDEMVTEIRLPLPWGAGSGSYQRISLRSAVDFPLVNAAAFAIMENGKVGSFRLVLSAVGPKPVMLRDVENLVKGNVPDPEMARKAGEMAMQTAEGTIVENASASREYRIRVARVLARRATQEALGMAGK